MSDLATDAWGRALECGICGRKLQHPRTGRPRVICRRKACLRGYHARHKRGQRRFSAQNPRCPSCAEPLSVPHLRSCPTHAAAESSQ